MLIATYRQYANGPTTSIRVEPGAVVVTMTADVWPCIVRGHLHTFDHWMTVKKGHVELGVDGLSKTLATGDRVLIEAGKRHVLVFEDGAVAECRHEHSDIHPDRTDGEGIPVEWLHRLTVRAQP